MLSEEPITLRFKDYQKTAERPAHPTATESGAAVLSFTSVFNGKTGASLGWISDCPPLAMLPKPAGEPTSCVDYAGSFFQALREVDMFRRQTKSLGSINPDEEMRRCVKDLPIAELFMQLKKGRDNWREHPELYAAIVDEICLQEKSADVSVLPLTRLKLFPADSAADTDDPMAERLAVEELNYLT